MNVPSSAALDVAAAEVWEHRQKGGATRARLRYSSVASSGDDSDGDDDMGIVHPDEADSASEAESFEPNYFVQKYRKLTMYCKCLNVKIRGTQNTPPSRRHFAQA